MAKEKTEKAPEAPTTKQVILGRVASATITQKLQQKEQLEQAISEAVSLVLEAQGVTERCRIGAFENTPEGLAVVLVLE